MSEIALNAQLSRAIDELPPVAPVIRRLLAVLDDPNSDLEDISKLIRADTALTANVLRLANSPLYAHSGHVSSIEDAVQQTGVLEVARVVTTLSAQQLFLNAMDNYKLSQGFLWKHTLAVAVAAEEMAERFLANAQAAYVSGLLHTVGMVTFEIAAKNQNLPVRKHTVPILDWEKATFGMENAELGGLVMKKWNLPAEIVHAVSTRHVPPTPKTINQLGGILYLASAMAVRATAGIPAESGLFPVSDDLLNSLRLTRDEFHELAHVANQKLSRLQAAF